MKVEGSCHCGEIVFEAEVDPDKVTICHCTDCQSLTGGTFRITVPARDSTFRLISGAPKHYVKRTADSGTPRLHGFCGECGAPIYSTQVAEDPRTYGLRVGALKQREALEPKRQIWSRSRLRWLPPLPGAAFEKE